MMTINGIYLLSETISSQSRNNNEGEVTRAKDDFQVICKTPVLEGRKILNFYLFAWALKLSSDCSQLKKRV